MYPEQLLETEMNIDYSDPLSDEKLRSFDVLSMDSTCIEEPKTI